MTDHSFKPDIIIVGAGLSGMVAAHEAILRGRKVLMLDQEAPQSLGGQAFWSLGGLFMVNSPEQRRLGIKDSVDLAYSDWMGSAQFDRAEDANPRAYAEKFIEWSAGDMRRWCFDLGMRWFPVVGWAERGGAGAGGHGNSVPRFHITWGTGTGVVAPFVKLMTQYASNGQLKIAFRHRATDLIKTNGAVTGVKARHA
jgi:predicted oxidoreductase